MFVARGTKWIVEMNNSSTSLFNAHLIYQFIWIICLIFELLILWNKEKNSSNEHKNSSNGHKNLVEMNKTIVQMNIKIVQQKIV